MLVQTNLSIHFLPVADVGDRFVRDVLGQQPLNFEDSSPNLELYPSCEEHVVEGLAFHASDPNEVTTVADREEKQHWDVLVSQLTELPSLLESEVQSRVGV